MPTVCESFNDPFLFSLTVYQNFSKALDHMLRGGRKSACVFPYGVLIVC